MYRNFKREFDASIEVLSKEQITFSEIVNRYIANQKDFSGRIFQAYRDHVLTEGEFRTLYKYFSDKTERIAINHLNNAVKNERP